MDIVVSANSISKSFGNVKVLQSLDFQVSRGELVAIMGKSGSGKSTLLHILGTLDMADSGTLNIANQAPDKMDTNKLAEFRNKEIGFVFQFHHLLAEFDLYENICMPGFIAELPKQEILSRADELICYFGLDQVKNQKPAQLSGGEQQRAAICRALFNSPSLLLADEPTGNLDQENAIEFHKIIKSLSRDLHHTFVIVTHQPDLADICDKVYVLEHGILHLK